MNKIPAPPCIEHGQKMLPGIISPFEGNLQGQDFMICIETPDGRKFKIHAEITSCMPARDFCTQCSHFAKIKNFSTKGDFTGIVLEDGGVMSIQKQPTLV